MSTIQNIPIGKLSISPLNARYNTPAKAVDTADLEASIPTHGIMQPITVIPNGSGDTYEIVMGSRRFLAAQRCKLQTVPAIVTENDDDVHTIESSLLENVARTNMPPLDVYTVMSKLIGSDGRTVDQVAKTFNTTPAEVERYMAIGNLCDELKAYIPKANIRDEDVHTLTLATEAQQKEYIKAHKSGKLMTGRHLKRWITGSHHNIPVGNELFDTNEHPLSTIADLFATEKETIYADAQAYWAVQQPAVQELKKQLLEMGWKGVDIIDSRDKTPHPVQNWEYTRVTKAKGGHVWLNMMSNGEVQVLKGVMPKHKTEHTKQVTGSTEPAKPKPEYPRSHEVFGQALRTLHASSNPSTLQWKQAIAKTMLGQPISTPKLHDKLVSTWDGITAAKTRQTATTQWLNTLGASDSAVTVTGCDYKPAALSKLDEAATEQLLKHLAQEQWIDSPLAPQQIHGFRIKRGFIDTIANRETLNKIARANGIKSPQEGTAKELRKRIYDQIKRNRKDGLVPEWIRVPPK